MSILQDLRFAARQLRRAPGFAAVACLSLAAGIGLNAVVFGVIDTVFLQGVRGVAAAWIGFFICLIGTVMAVLAILSGRASVL